MQHPRRRAGALLAQLALLILLAGCGPGQPAATTAPTTSTSISAAPSAGPPVPGITAVAYRTRIDSATTGQFQIQVHNSGTEPFTVLGVALDSAGFSRLPASPLETLFRPGATIDLRTAYGPVICDEDMPAEPAYAILDLLRPDGSQEQARVPMTSENETVPNMHAEDCAAEALAAAVDVVLTGLVVGDVDGVPTVTGELKFTRDNSRESIGVVDMRGSVVLQVRPGDVELPAVMATEESTLTVPIQIREATCDPHYLAETKQPFLFPLWLSFGDRAQEYSEIPVDAEQRVFLRDYLGEVCN